MTVESQQNVDRDQATTGLCVLTFRGYSFAPHHPGPGGTRSWRCARARVLEYKYGASGVTYCTNVTSGSKRSRTLTLTLAVASTGPS